MVLGEFHICIEKKVSETNSSNLSVLEDIGGFEQIMKEFEFLILIVNFGP